MNQRSFFIFSATTLALILSYIFIQIVAHTQGYYFNPAGSSLAFSAKSGTRYGFFRGGYHEYDSTTKSFNYTDDGLRLYRKIDTIGLFWKEIEGVYIGFTYNDFHHGTDLVISNDRTTLFIRRNTTKSPMWTDVLDIAADPPRTIIRGPDCCMESPAGDLYVTDSQGLNQHGQKVLELAKTLGL